MRVTVRPPVAVRQPAGASAVAVAAVAVEAAGRTPLARAMAASHKAAGSPRAEAQGKPPAMPKAPSRCPPIRTCRSVRPSPRRHNNRPPVARRSLGPPATRAVRSCAATNRFAGPPGLADHQAAAAGRGLVRQAVPRPAHAWHGLSVGDYRACHLGRARRSVGLSHAQTLAPKCLLKRGLRDFERGGSGGTPWYPPCNYPGTFSSKVGPSTL